MGAVLNWLLRLCLLGAGPQDLDYSPATTRLLVFAGVVADLVFVRMVGHGTDDLARVAVSLLMLLALPWWILGMRQRRARYAQTLAAFAASGVVFTLVLIPVAQRAAGLPPPSMEQPPAPEQLAIGWITLGLVAWKLAVNGHIWRHALDWPRFGGFLLALGILILEIGVMRALFMSS